MILTAEMENGFITYDVSTRQKWENFEFNYYDDVFVHWEKKNWLGKMVRSSKKFTFNRLRKYDGKKIYFEMDNACNSFIKRLHELQQAKCKFESSIVTELREEFNGADDFSLGVQHTLNKLHEKGII